MNHADTANRKRPQSFDALVGQEFVVETLKHSIDSGRIAHAYLFSGPRGVGKTSAARIMARALNCTSGITSAPCEDATLLDVIEIDGASNTSVNDVREIREEVLFAPSGSRYKIYIIDEVHMLSNSAFNALLKTIEEPPPYIVFIFATTEMHRVPATIRSRCQQFSFRMIPVETILACLQETCRDDRMQSDDDALMWIAKEARGSMRDAYMLLDQAISFTDGRLTFDHIGRMMGVMGLDRLNELAEQLAAGRAGQALQIVDRLLQEGVTVERLVIDLCEYYRNILFIRHGIEKQSLLGYPVDRFSSVIVESHTNEQIEEALDRLFELYRSLRYSLNQRFELDLMMSRLSLLGRRISATKLLDRLERLRVELLGSAGSSPIDAPKIDLASEAEAPVLSQDAASTASEEELPRRVIKALSKGHPLLAASLQKALDWSIAEDGISLRFEKSYDAQIVMQEQENIGTIVKDLIGKELKITIESVETDSSDLLEEKTERVRQIFQGEVIKR